MDSQQTAAVEALLAQFRDPLCGSVRVPRAVILYACDLLRPGTHAWHEQQLKHDEGLCAGGKKLQSKADCVMMDLDSKWIFATSQMPLLFGLSRNVIYDLEVRKLEEDSADASSLPTLPDGIMAAFVAACETPWGQLAEGFVHPQQKHFRLLVLRRAPHAELHDLAMRPYNVHADARLCLGAQDHCLQLKDLLLYVGCDFPQLLGPLSLRCKEYGLVKESRIASADSLLESLWLLDVRRPLLLLPEKQLREAVLWSLGMAWQFDRYRRFWRYFDCVPLFDLLRNVPDTEHMIPALLPQFHKPSPANAEEEAADMEHGGNKVWSSEVRNACESVLQWFLGRRGPPGPVISGAGFVEYVVDHLHDVPSMLSFLFPGEFSLDQKAIFASTDTRSNAALLPRYFDDLRCALTRKFAHFDRRDGNDGSYVVELQATTAVDYREMSLLRYAFQRGLLRLHMEDERQVAFSYCVMADLSSGVIEPQKHRGLYPLIGFSWGDHDRVACVPSRPASDRAQTELWWLDMIAARLPVGLVEIRSLHSHWLDPLGELVQMSIGAMGRYEYFLQSCRQMGVEWLRARGYGRRSWVSDEEKRAMAQLMKELHRRLLYEKEFTFKFGDLMMLLLTCCEMTVDDFTNDLMPRILALSNAVELRPVGFRRLTQQAFGAMGKDAAAAIDVVFASTERHWLDVPMPDALRMVLGHGPLVMLDVPCLVADLPAQSDAAWLHALLTSCADAIIGPSWFVGYDHVVRRPLSTTTSSAFDQVDNNGAHPQRVYLLEDLQLWSPADFACAMSYLRASTADRECCIVMFADMECIDYGQLSVMRGEQVFTFNGYGPGMVFQDMDLRANVKAQPEFAALRKNDYHDGDPGPLLDMDELLMRRFEQLRRARDIRTVSWEFAPLAIQSVHHRREIATLYMLRLKPVFCCSFQEVAAWSNPDRKEEEGTEIFDLRSWLRRYGLRWELDLLLGEEAEEEEQSPWTLLHEAWASNVLSAAEKVVDANDCMVLSTAAAAAKNNQD